MPRPVEKTEEQKKAEKRARRLARKEKAIRERIATAERTLANLPDRLDRVKPTAKPQVKEEVRGKLVLPERYFTPFEIPGVPQDIALAMWRAGAVIWAAANWEVSSISNRNFIKLWEEMICAIEGVKNPPQSSDSALDELQSQFEATIADPSEIRMSCLSFSVTRFIWRQYRSFFGSPAPGLWNIKAADIEEMLKINVD